jgi:hypothetical protein
MAGGSSSPPHGEAHNEDNSRKTPFRILGIAFVVDQKGTGARMIMRYPTAPSQPADEDDIFFCLGQRQLSKLFRPKPTLCKHPMTLAVGGTIFCCRAILLEDTEENSALEERVELFSVVVALAPLDRGAAIPITSWFEEQPQKHKKKPDDAKEEQSEKSGDDSKGTTASPSFLAVRRVHISLGRLCRVLEREEHRCQYVSAQSAHYLALRKQVHEESATTVPSPASVSSKPAHIRRTSTFSSIFEKDSHAHPPQPSKIKAKQTSETEQDILEMFLATEPLGSVDGPVHRGNLAAELVQFHHALARNDYSFPLSPSLLLTGRDGIVYINGHIAVAVEAVSPRVVEAQQVRPYETLLFPHASPKELLQSLAGFGSSASRRLQQVLLTVNPQKSLMDIAADANLSLHATMEIATYLVGKSAAVVSPVISRQGRFACDDIGQLQSVSLTFAHVFGADLDLFSLVSFLTRSGWKLEEAISTLVTSSDPKVVRLRAQLSGMSALVLLPNDTDELAAEPTASASSSSEPMGSGKIRDVLSPSLADLEETLFQLTVWLCSHCVLIQLHEYLVATHSGLPSLHAEEKSERKIEKDLSSDDALFQELQELDCLTGTLSIPACSWRVGIEASRLRAFAHRHRHIRLVLRPAAADDDWGHRFEP